MLNTDYVMIEVPRDRDMSEDEDEQDPDDRYTRTYNNEQEYTAIYQRPIY